MTDAAHSAFRAVHTAAISFIFNEKWKFDNGCWCECPGLQGTYEDLFFSSDNVCYSAGHWCTCCVIAIKLFLRSGATEVYNPHGLGIDGF